MATTLSTRGQVVLPSDVRAKLGLQPGMRFAVRTDGDNVVLIPQARRKSARLKHGRKTRRPAFVAPPGTPPLTSEFVRSALADFP